MTRKPSKGKPQGEDALAASVPEDLPERWSAQRKTELVLRLLRGEPLWSCRARSRSARPAAGGARWPDGRHD